jgi:hypothetical protein
MASGGGTLVEHLPHHPKVKGLSPAPGTKNGRENEKKHPPNKLECLSLASLSSLVNITL